MATFAIHMGATALCTWNIETSLPIFHSSVTPSKSRPVIQETDKVEFVLDPAPDGLEHRITIGDVPISDNPLDAGGSSMGGRRFWRSHMYFESARAITPIKVEARSEDSATEEWTKVLSVEVYVLPSKLGDDRYNSMVGDLQELSRSLLIDLYGKSIKTHDLRFARAGRAYRTPEQELKSIDAVLVQLGDLLAAIARRPASRVQVVPAIQNYWGSRPLSPTIFDTLARRGISPTTERRPFRIRVLQKVESFDIAEHRAVRAFLEILVIRANYCSSVARRHIQAINSEQHLRHLRLGVGPTLFEKVDQPKLRRLGQSIRMARRSAILAKEMSELPFLQQVQPQLAAVNQGAFHRSAEYRELYKTIRMFLINNAVWYEGDSMSSVTKLTSRLFEQWAFLKVVEAFRECGLELREWNDALRQNLQSRFVLDFDRGMMFEGELGNELRIRLRYEPWILGYESALQRGETLCRGVSSNVAWCPDIMIECIRHNGEVWQPVYGIVMDCKYKARLSTQEWTDATKYLEIRSTFDRRQVTKQLWLIAPSRQDAIQCEDPAVRFDDNGPSCAPDEAIRFRLLVMPADEDRESAESTMRVDPFIRFAQGTIAFLRRIYMSNLAE